MTKFIFLLLLFNLSVFADNCITYQNMTSKQLRGELIEVKGTSYWGHGEEIIYYIFRIDSETCFDDGDGPIDTNEVQVILNEEQLKNIEQLLSKEVKMQIKDFLWGGTQQWKRSIGVPKAKFILNSD